MRLALDLAARLDVPVVFLCSREAATAGALGDLSDLARARGVQALVVCVPDGSGTLTRLDVDDLKISKAYRRGGRPDDDQQVPLNDVGRKRNLALLLARSMGWRHVLFLDDDVFPKRLPLLRRLIGRPTLDPATLAAAVRLVEKGTHRAVGWILRGFDDNSVLCRIRADTGQAQDQFVGGGALLVAIDDETPYFPAIYNEDWLFLLAYVARGVPTPVGYAGDVGQEPYDAYTPNRARAEERGDVLGEELGDILGEALASAAGGRGSGFWQADRRFWQSAVAERIRLRKELEQAVAGWRRRDGSRQRAALLAVAQVHGKLGPRGGWVEQLAGYGPAWVAGLTEWQGRLEQASSLPPLTVLTEYELTTHVEASAGGVPVAPANLLARWRRPRPTTSPVVRREVPADAGELDDLLGATVFPG